MNDIKFVWHKSGMVSHSLYTMFVIEYSFCWCVNERHPQHAVCHLFVVVADVHSIYLLRIVEDTKQKKTQKIVQKNKQAKQLELT